MSKVRRKFSKELKLEVVREINAGKSVPAAAREHAVHSQLIYKWLDAHKKYEGKAFAGNGKAYKDEARIAELERLAGQLAYENSVLKKALKKLEQEGFLTGPRGGR